MHDCLVMILQVPTGETLTFGDDNFIKFEEAGVREARRAAFVLVAGGLGERLGYNGIKVYYLYHFFCSIILCHDDILYIQVCCCFVKINQHPYYGVRVVGDHCDL